jgi:Grx4 family monothiol glutaredoxin
MSILEVTSPIKTGKTVLLFYAPWHEDSVSLKESVIPALMSSASGAEIRFGTVEAESFPAVSQHYKVAAVPSFVFIDSDGQVIERIEGNIEIAQVTQAVQRLIHLTEAKAREAPYPPEDSSEAKDTLHERLSKLVKSSEVMLFMKGHPTAPRCGFSRQAVELLIEAGINFGSFDILSDEAVRQGLKQYADWPTYPMLFVRGELVGGLDIMKEMKEEGNIAGQIGIAAEPTLDERLGKLIKRSHIMLFMKGVPSAPRCGFSRQMVELLDNEGASYDAFNILEDEEVRQGLKTFSDWPTYPQLYVEGEFIGGLDICKELAQSGELSDVLKRQS